MNRTDGLTWNRILLGAGVLAMASTLAVITATDADAQRRRNNQEEENDPADRTFTARIGEIVLEAQNQQAEELFQESIATLNRALAMEPNPYERSVMLQMRGRAHYEQERLQSAIDDWLGAISAGGMISEEIANLRINIGQLLIAEEQYARGIAVLEEALADPNVELTPRLAKMLAQAYGQAERYPEGLRYAEFAFNNTAYADRVRGDYQLSLFYYQQLERLPDQLRLIEEMVGRWPQEKNNWTTYASLLAQLNREGDAFEVNKIMYVNGMLTESREIVRVAQYYSFYEYPFRGAIILERELNAGRVERTRENLNLLANMWRQSREFERAIPVLRQVAQLTGDGDDFAKLGEALYQREQRAEAIEAFEQALDRGGLNRTGTIWNLLGTARYELDRRQGALAAFAEGARYPYSRSTANGWATFIRAEMNAEREREALQARILREECRLIITPLVNGARILGDVNEQGEVVIEVPTRCVGIYDSNGNEIRAGAGGGGGAALDEAQDAAQAE
jgi:tetratricopeptide (TPR) repeat protein